MGGGGGLEDALVQLPSRVDKCVCIERRAHPSFTYACHVEPFLTYSMTSITLRQKFTLQFIESHYKAKDTSKCQSCDEDSLMLMLFAQTFSVSYIHTFTESYNSSHLPWNNKQLQVLGQNLTYIQDL